MQTTQWTLIEKLRDPQNSDAWERFVIIYFPSVVWALQRKGLRLQEAEEVAQGIMLSVSQSLAKRPHDRERAKFRTWLNRITRNAAINAMRRQPLDAPAGGDETWMQLQEVASDDPDAVLFEEEHRKQLFLAASIEVEKEFASDTWAAFWRTAVLGETPETVARDLGKQVGSVYAARSRVTHRLRERVESMQDFS